MSQADRHYDDGEDDEGASSDGALALFTEDELREEALGLEAENADRTEQVTGNARFHTDGENIRHNWGLSTFGNLLERLERRGHPIVEYPRAFLDTVIHVDDLDKIRLEREEWSGLSKSRRQVFQWLADRPELVSQLRNGGTDALLHGEKGSGKSTFALTLAARLLEVNNERVVWRGSSSRSEWLPLAPWARVCLPEGLEVETILKPPGDLDVVEIELEDVVREVVRYDDLRDLNYNKMVDGAFHVVYPDPKFRDCEGALRRHEEISEIPYTSAWDVASDPELERGDVTPAYHWWFAWAISRINDGPSAWTSWFCDEIGNVMPEHASNDDHRLHDRIEAFRDTYVDARRNRFSTYVIGHDPDDAHHLMRKKMRWRITMNGVDNPTDGEVVGMGSPPMSSNHTGYMSIGEALSWTSQYFAPVGWEDVPEEYKIASDLQVRFPEVTEVLGGA